MPSRLPVVGGDSGAWGTVLNDWLTKTTAGIKNVQVYGATGDGVTDDTVAFAAARDAAGVGGSVYVPPGTYVLTGLALSTAGQTWKLEQGATTLTKPSSGTTAQIAVTGAGVTILGPGTLDGNRANGTPGNNQDIITVNADKFTLAGAVVQNGTRAGVYVGGSASFNEMVITNCRFSNIGLQAIGTFGSIAAATDGVQITDNVIDQYGATVWQAGVYGPNGIQLYNWPMTFTLSNVLIANNYIRCFPYLLSELTNQDAGIVMAGISNYTITGNTIASAAFGMSIPSCNYGTISGNTVTAWSTYGIEMSSNSTVVGNMLNNTDPRAASGTHSGAAVLSAQAGGQYMNITGNQMYHVATAAGASVQIFPISPNDINHVTVADNQCLHLGGGTALIFNKAVCFLTVRGNVIDGNGQFLVCCQVVADIAASPITQFAVSVTDNIFANYSTGTGILWGQTGTMASPALDYAIFANNIFRSGTNGIGVLGAPTSGAHCNIAAGSNIGP